MELDLQARHQKNGGYDTHEIQNQNQNIDCPSIGSQGNLSYGAQ